MDETAELLATPSEDRWASAERPDQRHVRATILGADDGITFAATPDMVPALVAALATNPTSVEALLLAYDDLYAGTAAHIVGALIAHDRLELLWQQGYGAPPPMDIERGCWGISDEESLASAQEAASAGLLIFNLTQRTIYERNLTGAVAMEGAVPVFDGRRFQARTVTYDLRADWRLVSMH